MGFKEIIQRAKERKEQKKESFRQMQDQDRMETTLGERKKSSDLRELESYIKENEAKQIKEQLIYMRKERQNDIRFNHNALDVKNITNHTDWNVLKERNMFKSKKNMFVNQPPIYKSNNNTLKSKRRLHGI